MEKNISLFVCVKKNIMKNTDRDSKKVSNEENEKKFLNKSETHDYLHLHLKREKLQTNELKSPFFRNAYYKFFYFLFR